jgi:hypothetical protein
VEWGKRGSFVWFEVETPSENAALAFGGGGEE